LCTSTPTATLTVSLSGTNAGPVSFTLTTSGSFYVQAVYAGDANNNAASSACASGSLTVGKASPTVSATLPSSTITVGDATWGSATIVGGYKLGGTVSYEYIAGSACPGSGSKTVGSPVTVSNGAVPKSDSLGFDSVGLYGLYAIYSGDQNNLASVSSCQTLTVVPVLSPIPPITITAGSTVRFTVNATDPDTSQVVTLTPSNLPPGATFSTAQSYTDGTTSSTFTWTPSSSLSPGDYNVTFTAAVGSVKTTTQAIIHVVEPLKSSPLPLASYSIFGLVGFAAVLTVAVLLRRFRSPRKVSRTQSRSGT
jgi:hypothetical protein